MGVGNALIGIGATLLSKLFSPDAWSVINTETGESLSGDFPHEGMSREVGSNIAQIQSLNRQNPILQFLNGKADTLSLKSRFRYMDITDDEPVKKVEQLIKWVKLDPIVRRPPVCIFSLGSSSNATWQVLLESVSNIEYSQTDFLGTVREVTFTLNMIRYFPFSLDDQQATDTRYARARERDYYELLAWQEYGNPMLGVVIRQRHPQQLTLVPGNIVKLPSIEGVRTVRPAQTSLQLKNAYSRRDTDARRLRLQWFARRSVPYTSFVSNITPRTLPTPVQTITHGL